MEIAEFYTMEWWGSILFLSIFTVTLLKLTSAVRLGTQLGIWTSSVYSLQTYCYWQEWICKSASASLWHLKVVPQTTQVYLRELDINLTVQPEQITAPEKKMKATLKLLFKEELLCFSPFWCGPVSEPEVWKDWLAHWKVEPFFSLFFLSFFLLCAD